MSASAKLQTKDRRELLDLFVKLRSLGVDRYVDLPEIIVCGDQSAGKSSVLEAISGHTFKIKENLCTRFATELILRYDLTIKVDVSIVPGPERSPTEQERLQKFGRHIDLAYLEERGLELVIDEAHDAIGISHLNRFSTDTLRVVLQGPDQVHLTLVDLPGLFSSGSKDQTQSDADTVSKMVRKCMGKERTVILAVVSAGVNFNNQILTRLIQEVHPNGARTLGLITKPDLIPPNSDSEKRFIRMAKNEDVQYSLGWHVLRNRSHDMHGATSADRDDVERKFFSQGIWASLDQNILGISSLKTRLGGILEQQMQIELPAVLGEVTEKISESEARLKLLGSPRVNLREQRHYLARVSNQFSILIRATIEGSYNHDFFGSAETEEGYEKRLRAVVQNTLTAFQERIRTSGHSKTIIDDDSFMVSDGVTFSSRQQITTPSSISRSAYINEVEDLMRRSRGCELPGMFNPIIIRDIFTKQCRPWQHITEQLSREILRAVRRTISLLISHIAAKETVANISEHIDQRIMILEHDLKEKILELLPSYGTGHPITYSQKLTEKVKDVQARRRRKQIEKHFQATFRRDLEVGQEMHLSGHYPIRSLIENLVSQTEPNIEQYGSSVAVDYMEAYYDLALERFIDDVGVLGVENCVISRLPYLFEPFAVSDMTDTEISQLVRESSETSSERSSLSEKLSTLQKTLDELRRADRLRSTMNDEFFNTSGNSTPLSSVDVGKRFLKAKSNSPESPLPAAPEYYVENESPVIEPSKTVAGVDGPSLDVPDNEWNLRSSAKKGKKHKKKGQPIDLEVGVATEGFD